MFVHHLAQPESLGIIAWLLHCCSLAFCAQGMAGCKASPDCCHKHPSFVPHGAHVLLSVCINENVYAQIGAIMPARICTDRCDHACALFGCMNMAPILSISGN
jgi:hypothetical protein